MKKLLGKFFRCPFHAIAKKNNQLFELTLSEGKIERYEQIENAFRKLYVNTELKAMILSMPPSLLANCQSIVDVKDNVLPYQCELLATEFHLRLYPFLPYQINTCDKASLEELFSAKPMECAIAFGFITALNNAQMRIPKNITDLSAALLVILKSIRARGAESGSFSLGDLLKVYPSGVIFPHEFTPLLSKDPTKNKNIFSIVTCPFYPIEFGRYSKDIKIVITRHTDFEMLSRQERQAIREHANTVLKQGGVMIENLAEDKQPDGVWIPKYHQVAEKIS